MPSKEHAAATERDFVDELVAEIKENLRLKTKPCHIVCKQRTSPYWVPIRFGGQSQCSKCESCGSPKCRRTCHKGTQEDATDHYEALQQLLRDKNLIKEAVRRVQLGFAVAKNDDDNVYYEESDSPRT